MARNDDPHKESAGVFSRAGLRCLLWIESHPRTGWYVAVMATLNLVLNLIDAFDLF